MIEGGTRCPAQAHVQVWRSHGATTRVPVDLLGSTLARGLGSTAGCALGFSMCTVALGFVFHPNPHPVKYALTITTSPGDTDTESKHPVLLGAAQQNWPLAWRPGFRAVTRCYLHGAKAALGLCVWCLCLLLMCRRASCLTLRSFSFLS